MSLTPWDSETEYRIERSETPVTEDGYKIGEPKWLICETCTAHVLLTEEPSAGVDELDHDLDCPQRWVRSEWWSEQFLGGRR